MRSLDPEEAALWARVAATIKPLSRDRADQQSLEIKSFPPTTKPKQAVVAVTVKKPLPAAPRGVGSTLDGGWDRRLSRGAVSPDRVLDLHGHNLDRAWTAIDSGLERAIAAGDRVVLLITGHQRKGDPPLVRGKIRAVVNDWLAASRHAPHIAAIRPAHRSHGGGGSLYLVLRRR